MRGRELKRSADSLVRETQGLADKAVRAPIRNELLGGRGIDGPGS